MKIFVVVAGVLLVVGSITLVALLITRGANLQSRTAFSHEISVPGTVKSMQVIGSELALLVEHDGQQLILLVDPETGRERGRLMLTD